MAEITLAHYLDSCGDFVCFRRVWYFYEPQKCHYHSDVN